MSEATRQRINMVDGQVRPSDITDRRIIRAMLAVPREAFVPAQRRALAYSDGDIALNVPGRVLLAPRVFAKLLQLAAFGERDRVLVVASGSGYGAAVLGAFADRVVALESDAGLHAEAVQQLKESGPGNVEPVQAPLAEGDAQRGPYDVILIEGAVTAVPDHLLGQLKEGGRLVTIVKDGASAYACLWLRSGRTYAQVRDFDANTPVLQEFSPQEHFAL